VKGYLRLIGLLFSILAYGAACETGVIGDVHPPDLLDYPIDVIADPSGRIVWVTSGNFDLAYQGGAVLAVDVLTHEFVTAIADDGTTAPVSFQLGGFPGPFSLLQRDGKAVAGYSLSRTDRALYHVQISGSPEAPELQCPHGKRHKDGILVCPLKGATTTGTIQGDEAPIAVEVGKYPYGTLIHQAGPGEDQDVLLAASLWDGTLSAFGLDVEGTPTFQAVEHFDPGLFAMAENPVTGHIYATNKSNNAIDVFRLLPPPSDEFSRLFPNQAKLEKIDSIVVPVAPLDETTEFYARYLAVAPDGSRLFVAFRLSSTVVVIDISQSNTAQSQGYVLAKIPVGASPSDVELVPATDTTPELLYVSCFADNRVDVVDPSIGIVIDTIRTGEGPFGLAYVDNDDIGIRRLYVTNFYSHSLGVIELDPTSPYYHSQVAEIR
jgi:hypothetical protein